MLPRLEAIVGGRHVVVEYTNTRTPGYNLISLPTPQVYDGNNPTVKRTDFLFLEVWLALVAPSPAASGSVQVVDATAIADGDVITIDGTNLTATLVPGQPDTFIYVPNDENATASNIADAINLVTNSFVSLVTARANLDVVTFKAIKPGAGEAGNPNSGNFITLTVTTANPNVFATSGLTLTGGADRPNKPSSDQSKLYRHGNTMSAPAVWLDDEIIDPIVDAESSQRVQLQYRIRATGVSEGVNYKKHPDGFSNLNAGPPPVGTIFAQGARGVPVNDPDNQSYPFVPADQAKVWLDSSASAYGIEDNGLWIAGDGTEQSAKDLGSVDGFVYAIPICFVHRHNNVSDALAGFKGWDAKDNANGAPRHDHAAYNGPLGTIPANKSDRPDGEFCDVITQQNILDLRRHVVFPGIDMAAELQFQLQSLLDGNLRTWSVDTADKQDLGGDSGDVSTRFLICNEIGRSLAQGGSPPLSGDTQRGVFIRNFDHIARRFGDQPVVERVVFGFYPGDRPSQAAQGGVVAPGTANRGKYLLKIEDPLNPGTPKDPNAWYEGDVLHLDLEELNATTLGGIFHGADGGGNSAVDLATPGFSDFAPPGTIITDVLGMWHDDGHYTTAVDQSVQATSIKGLGTQHLEITLDANNLATAKVNGGNPATPDYNMVGSDIAGVIPAADADLGSKRRIFVEVEITYPIGSGTTDTPDWDVVPDPTVYDGDGAGPGPIIEVDTNQRPNDHEATLPPRFRRGFREVQLEYIANDTISHAQGAENSGTAVGGVNTEQIVSRNTTDLYFPRRIYGASSGVLAQQTSVTDAVDGNPRTVDESVTEFGASSRKVVLSTNAPGTPLSGAGQTLCTISYFPQDPIPNYGVQGGGYQVAVYYRSNSPQTAGVKEGNILSSGDGTVPTTLQIEPLYVSPNVWTGQVGMGSLDLAYPYGSPLDQIPIKDAIQTIREWYFCATASVTIDDFNAETGLLALHPFVQMDMQEVLELGGTENDKFPLKDAEFRAFYPFADDSTYRPTIFAQPLFGPVRHKVFVPVLARATKDTPGVAGGLLYRKDELLLVVLTRFAELDEENNVRFTDPVADNRTCAAVYRTRNLLLTVGGKTC